MSDVDLSGRDRAVWVINSACPSRCVYCDIGSQRLKRALDEAEAVRTAEQILEAGYRQVTFVGGEPLIYPHIGPVLDTLRGRAEVALFTGGLSGDPGRWIDLIARGVDRMSISIDHGDDSINDVIRGRPNITRDLLALLDALRARLPDLDLGVSTVVSKHNIDEVDTVFDRMRGYGLTNLCLLLGGDNFEGSPSEHFASLAQLRRFYLETAPQLARRAARESPDTDVLVFPVPLPFLFGRTPVSEWDTAAAEHGPAIDAALEDYARGDYNRAFVERFGCPLVGRDIAIGVGGEVHPCSQAPILKPTYVLGNVRETPLPQVLTEEAIEGFRARVPEPPCRRCWAPSNLPPEMLRALGSAHGSSGHMDFS